MIYHKQYIEHANSVWDINKHVKTDYHRYIIGLISLEDYNETLDYLVTDMLETNTHYEEYIDTLEDLINNSEELILPDKGE